MRSLKRWERGNWTATEEAGIATRAENLCSRNRVQAFMKCLRPGGAQPKSMELAVVKSREMLEGGSCLQRKWLSRHHVVDAIRSCKITVKPTRLERQPSAALRAGALQGHFETLASKGLDHYSHETLHVMSVAARGGETVILGSSSWPSASPARRR